MSLADAIASGDASYANACAGTGSSLFLNGSLLVGQQHGSAPFDYSFITYLEFDTSSIVSATSAKLRVTIDENFADNAVSVSYNNVTVLVAPHDFGATLDTADWLDTAALSSLTPAGSIASNGPGSGDIVDITLSPGVINAGGITRLVMFTDHQASATPADVGANTQIESWQITRVLLVVNDSIVDGPPASPLAGPCVQVIIGDFIADGATPDTNGILYTVEDVGGWFDSIPVRSATLEAQPRGETVTVAHEGGRALDVRITAHTSGGIALGNAACFAATEAIKTAFRAVYVPVLMQVIDPYATGGRQLLARRVGPIKQQILGAGVAVSFQIPMLGEDPRRFASP